MQPLRPRPSAHPLSDKARAALQNRPRIKNTAPAHVARARVQEAMRSLQGSSLAGSPIGLAFQEFLQDRLSKGQDLEDFIEEVKGVAEEHVRKRRHIISFLSTALQLLRSDNALMRVRTEVIQPARTRQLSGQQAWDRVSTILKTPYPFLNWVGNHVGDFTIGAAVQGGFGAGAGVGATLGISGLRHCLACYFEQASVCVGAVAGADVGAQLSIAPAKPSAGISYGLEVAAGGGWNATGSVTVALIPIPHKPTLQEPWFFDYKFAGLAVSMGGGGGLNVSVALGATRSYILGGRLS